MGGTPFSLGCKKKEKRLSTSQRKKKKIQGTNVINTI
jgi:hypothetical protein